jgi:hypothetical protein
MVFKVFNKEAHMSGSEIDDGTDKATAWKRRLDIVILKEMVVRDGSKRWYWYIRKYGILARDGS